MRSIILLAALAALATLTNAAARNTQPIKPLPPSALNATHFLDPQTTKIYRRHACAAHDDTNATTAFKHLARALHAKTRSRATGARAPAALARRSLPHPLTINAYFHIITTAAKASTITPSMAAAQAAALNAAYNPIGITINHVNTSFTTNDAWAFAEGAAMDELKFALRAGSYADLNLYFHSDLAGGILGTCTLPSRLPPASPRALYASDGCNIAAGTLPGGSIEGYNSGGTAAHETGHWLGLLHVFEGYDCSGEGDLVDDTPAQSESTDGCPVGKDSCPGLGGEDSVHNWMDYSTDACYEGFTAGQVGRVGEMWGLREGL